jgi:hypothetical protein
VSGRLRLDIELISVDFHFARFLTFPELRSYMQLMLEMESNVFTTRSSMATTIATTLSGKFDFLTPNLKRHGPRITSNGPTSTTPHSIPEYFY